MSVNHSHQLSKGTDENISLVDGRAILGNSSENAVAAVNNDPLSSLLVNLSCQGRGNQGIFNNARNFVMNHPVMAENAHIQRVGDDQPSTVLHLLSQFSTPGAEMDSSARHPAPQCHPGTRRGLLTRIGSWSLCRYRGKNLFWLYGPAGVGKSAVAQTIAEYCDTHHCLGAAFFFSRPNDRYDPSKVIPTLSYQLAVRSPDYKRLIAHILANDPKILEKALPIQFQKVIVEPFLILQDQKIFEGSLIIILDGLDECEGDDAQCEFVKLISDQVRSQPNLPLVWMIYSRPEPHLMRMLSAKDLEPCCWSEELEVDTAESREDVALYIRDEFEKLKQRFPESVPEDWPPNPKATRITKASSGLFVFASTAMKFIGDPVIANPEAQLDSFISFLDRRHINNPTNPLQALDLLYEHILSGIPPDVLPMTKRILQVSFGSLGTDTNSAVVCNFIGIRQGTYYSSLRKLHSVIDIPPPSQASRKVIKPFHASFLDYLSDQKRSGKFYIDSSTIDREDVLLCLKRVQQYFFNRRPDLPWKANESSSFELKSQIINYFWESISLSNAQEDPALSSTLYSFNFAQLSAWSTAFHFQQYPVIRFLRWARRKKCAGDHILDNLVRTQSISKEDDALLGYFKEELTLRQARPFDFTNFEGWDAGVSYFLVGFGSRVLLVVRCADEDQLEFWALDAQKLESLMKPKRRQDRLRAGVSFFKRIFRFDERE